MTQDLAPQRPEDLLQLVSDKETFIAFVTLLATERERAAQIEIENPRVYQVDGALNWKNADIESFLYAALDYFVDGPLREPIPDHPTWKMFAEFLYCGKIIE